MAVFRAKQNVCELNFDDKFHYELPLHEEVADKLQAAYDKLRAVQVKDRAGIDAAYDTALDCLDDILGAGEAENVMSLFEKPGVFDVIKVIIYIANEWKAAYSAEVEKIQAAAPNREQRRARR